MPIIKGVRGFYPVFGKNCFIADNATIIGDVIAGDYCSFWFGCVVRGDVNSIRLGNYVNIQDGVIIHATYQRTVTIIGDNVSIGHRAVVHGCKIGNNVLIGIGAIILDNVVIEDNVVVGAGAVLTEGMHIPSGSVVAGVPARKIKDIDERLLKDEIMRIAKNYPFYASWYQQDTKHNET